MKFCHLFTPYRPNQILPRSLFVGSITTISLLLGIVPELSGSHGFLTFSSLASAQEVRNEDVTNYARAVLAMEPIRQQTRDKLKQIVGATNVPRFFACSPDKVNGLSDTARDTIDNYCTNAQNIVSSNNLTIKQFNDITNAVSGNPPADPVLKQRVQQELIRLQSQ